MTDKENQIEELTKVYEEAQHKANNTLGSMNDGAAMWYATEFYNAGYRKCYDINGNFAFGSEIIPRPLWQSAIYQRNELKSELTDIDIAIGTRREKTRAEYIKKLQAENEELKDRCNYIWAIGCDYDGANPNDATQMRQLVDELVGIAVDGLEQTVFCGDEKTEIQPRVVKLYNLKAENARLTEQLKNTVEALKAMKKLINSELEEAEARLAELKEN